LSPGRDSNPRPPALPADYLTRPALYR